MNIVYARLFFAALGKQPVSSQSWLIHSFHSFIHWSKREAACRPPARLAEREPAPEALRGKVRHERAQHTQHRQLLPARVAALHHRVRQLDEAVVAAPVPPACAAGPSCS